MARIWKEPLDEERHLEFMSTFAVGGMPIDRMRSDGSVYFVRECAFTFQFASLDQLRSCIDYFSTGIHPSRRVPGVHLEHYWQKWSERLPAGLTRTSKRRRIHAALRRALTEFTGGDT